MKGILSARTGPTLWLRVSDGGATWVRTRGHATPFHPLLAPIWAEDFGGVVADLGCAS